MPRPTAAQLAYGSCTVILSTLAMLLLSQTSSGVGIAVIALAALGLGLLVAMTVPQPKSRGLVARTNIPEAVPERVSALRESTLREPALLEPALRESVAATPEAVREPSAS
ncbi:hypothetical protein [Streptomyces mangrovisoli]|uniref:Uncharacterized protein n=1 Tax=Streptomyces mangrovisoli TaxID=1428628 RepID=A0A1J4P1P2_9ACTN|nr:hypothetical protein [Streptomyces mangrovisoli]OIJ67652.1 hypothetical protein WN71_012030 [Streptomyces mangrovisoli]